MKIIIAIALIIGLVSCSTTMQTSYFTPKVDKTETFIEANYSNIPKEKLEKADLHTLIYPLKNIDIEMNLIEYSEIYAVQLTVRNKTEGKLYIRSENIHLLNNGIMLNKVPTHKVANYYLDKAESIEYLKPKEPEYSTTTTQGTITKTGENSYSYNAETQNKSNWNDAASSAGNAIANAIIASKRKKFYNFGKKLYREGIANREVVPSNVGIRKSIYFWKNKKYEKLTVMFLERKFEFLKID